MTRMLADLAAGAEPHPAARGQGWWRRDVRLEFQPTSLVANPPPPERHFDPEPAPTAPILIAGATGTLGQALARACRLRGLPYLLTDRRQMPLADPDAIAAVMALHRPWAVINAAGWVRVDDAELDPDGCRQANTVGAVNLARAALGAGAHYTSFSSDLVFGGQLERPYVESDATRPLNVYGQTKEAAEKQVLALAGQALMVRTAAFFSADDPYNFAAEVTRQLTAGRPLRAAADLVMTPTYVPDLCHAVLDLVIDGETGLWHLSNGEAVTWADFGQALADTLGLDRRLIRPALASELGWRARRPQKAPLATERGRRLPDLRQAIEHYAVKMRDTVHAHPGAAQDGAGRVGWVA
jgi:dTDP-4-dehydrorhamnose reductase